MQTELSWKLLTRYVKFTPLQHSVKLSKLYNANIFLKKRGFTKNEIF